jgi:hypothetical protein
MFFTLFGPLVDEGDVTERGYLLKLVAWACGEEDARGFMDMGSALPMRAEEMQAMLIKRKITTVTAQTAIKRRPRFDNEGVIMDGFYKLLELQQDQSATGAEAQNYVHTLVSKIGTSMRIKELGMHAADGTEARADEDMAEIWRQRNEAVRNETKTGGAE